MAIASWMESKDVMPGIEAAVRRTEAIEAAAKAVDAVAPQMWPAMAPGSVAVPLHLLWALRVALRGAA